MAFCFSFFLSAVISASEAAYFSFSSYHLDRFKASPDKRNKLIAELLGRPRLLLVSFIVLNTFVNIGIITLAASLVSEITQASDSQGVVILLALFLCVITIAVVGEIIPRMYGTKKQYPDSTTDSLYLEDMDSAFETLLYFHHKNGSLAGKKN